MLVPQQQINGFYIRSKLTRGQKVVTELQNLSLTFTIKKCVEIIGRKKMCS